MKKQHLLIMAAAIGVLSCSRQDVMTDTGDDSAALKLSVMMAETQTRNLISGKSLPEDSEIGIALYGENGRIYENLPYSNVRFHAQGQGSGQTWAPDTDVMLSAGKATLYAYYPYSSDVRDIASVPVKASSTIQTDYMYADPVSGLYNHSANAQVTFRHALSAVRVSLRRGSYSGTGTVSSVSIKGGCIGTSGIMNAKTGSISGISGKDSEISPAINSFDLSSTPYQTDIICIPSGTESSMIIKVVIDGVEFSITTDPVNLTAGKIAVYDAVVDNSELSLSSVKINDWTFDNKGNPVIRNDWTISISGDTEDISFASSMGEDGSIKIIAVPILPEASVDPVTLQGEAAMTEVSDISRGTRTIILSDIRSDVNLVFNGYSLWASITYDITDISQPVWITKATPGTICKRMVVDGVEVPPASKYQFTETGSHVVKFAFNPFINSGNLLAKYHIPEVGFKDVADIVAISIPEGYTLFRNQVFSGCEKLTSVSLPSTLKSVGYSTFAYCDSLSEIDLPDNILRFPDHQFNKCKNLKRVKLPANLENLGSYTFQSCSSLQEVDIPESVKEIGYAAFKYSGITRVDIPDNVSVIPEEMCMMCTKLLEVRLPASLTTMKRQCFYGCSSLDKVIQADGSMSGTELVIPEGVTSVQRLLIMDSKFTALHLPSTLTDIVQCALASGSVERITINDANPRYTVKGNSVIDMETNILIAGCKGSTIDESVSILGPEAFYSCPIDVIDLHAGVKEIQERCFVVATPSVIISRALTPPAIGENAFQIAKYNGTFKAPEEALNAYKEQWWKDEIGYLGWRTAQWRIKALAEGE